MKVGIGGGGEKNKLRRYIKISKKKMKEKKNVVFNKSTGVKIMKEM